MDDAPQILALAETMAGFIEIKAFTATDGERVSVITFADQASHDAWRHHVDHVAAQKRGRSDYYSEYTLQVCSTIRVSRYGPDAGGILDRSQISG